MPSDNSLAELEQRIFALEKQLAESQACLDFFNVEAPVGLVIFDRDCRYVQVNQYLARFTSFSTAEHLGKKPSDLLPPQLAVHIEDNVRKIVATGEAQLNQRFSFTRPREAEPPRHWRTSRFPLRDTAGHITGVGFIVVEETGIQQLQKSLDQQEALHLALLESIPARIFMKDCSGTYLYCNDIFAADVGVAKAEIIGKNDFDLFRSDMASRYRQADLAVIYSGQTHEFEYQFEKNCREYFIKVRKTPFRNQKGNILGILGIFQDLSEKRLAERQLLIADHALAATLSGIAILDPAGILTYANPAFLTARGFIDSEGLLGRSADEFWINPTLSRQIIEELHENGQWQGEMSGLRKDGSSFPSLLTANMVTDAAGNRICIIISCVDISARKAIEQQLRESEEQLRQIADNIDDAVWVMDLNEKRLLYVSPAYEKIWGQPREALSRDPEAWLQAVHPDDQEALTNSLRQNDRGKQDSYRVVRPDGSIRHVFARTFPVLDVNGKIYREVGIVQDVSEIKEAEAKILSFSRRLNNAVERERSAIARDLHDEFGQTLVHLRQWQKTLDDTTATSSRAQVDHVGLNKIINQLGSTIRNATHRLRPDILDNLGLAAAIELEVKDFGRRFDPVAATFQLVGQPRPIDNEYALVLYRILQETLTNAARHAKAKNLQVRLIFSFPTIIMTVDDDGVGFDPGILNSHDKDLNHWGLRGISERLATIGGRASITSRPGLGTSIRVELNEGQNPTDIWDRATPDSFESDQ